MPEERRQIVDADRHRDVVHRRVGEGADGAVGGAGTATEQPDVTGPGGFERGCQRDAGGLAGEVCAAWSSAGGHPPED